MGCDGTPTRERFYYDAQFFNEDGIRVSTLSFDLPACDSGSWTGVANAMIERHSNHVAASGASYVAIEDKSDASVHLLKLERVTTYKALRLR